MSNETTNNWLKVKLGEGKMSIHVQKKFSTALINVLSLLSDLFTSIYLSVDAGSIPEIAFITSGGHYVYFAMARAPAVFQRAVNKSLSSLKDTLGQYSDIFCYCQRENFGSFANGWVFLEYEKMPV